MEAQPTLRCRLCLTVFSDSDRTQLRDIFRDDNGDHFGCKVRECTGVYVTRQDSLTTACANCVQTVHFIDEFRNLCRQSDRSLVRAAFDGVTGFGPARWESYSYHVRELRKLLEPQQEENVGGGSGYLPETVFVKGQQGPAEVGFEWEDVEEMVAVKQEVVGSDEEDEVEEGLEEVVGSDDDGAPRRKRNRVNWEVDPLTLAKAIHRLPVLWNAKQDGHRQSYQRDRAWTQLATETGLNKDKLKKMWCSLNDMFHRKRWGSDASDVQLYQLLETMFSASIRRRSKFGLSNETRAAMAKISNDNGENERMKLAQIFYKHEDIWNRTHPDFDKQTKWTNLATQLNTTVDELKRHWKCFKDIYYARRRRLQTGEIKPTHQCLQDPFFLLLEKMWIKNARPAQRQPVPLRTTANISAEEVEPLPANNRMQLTQLIYDREVIWNRSHPDHPVLAKRDEAFDEVARELGMSMPELKHHWRTLRSFYCNRYLRMKRGQIAPDHPLLHEPVYLMLRKIFGDESSGGGEEGE
ncbi:uncharacterized protein LOC120425097 [Culex pipiens pallens]|uniref:uncharacterized protein LOC120425097 n=1 Tax=Culex pipiens pallens TaxID=42434 RepID=UPI001954A0C4|nr:uncharacterized protein LOC120425097 [Culex pipiens pallens]